MYCTYPHLILPVGLFFARSSNAADVKLVHMGIVWDENDELGLDNDLTNPRDLDTGIMGWTQWSYLMDHQFDGQPAYYKEGEEEW